MRTVLLLGSGAITIGQAGEFDYSGTQAIKALKEEGVRVILVNPNVATIQTSAGLADRVYFLPVTEEFVTRVIEKEKPQAILLSFGGQTALNCGIGLYQSGSLARHHVKILGTPIEAIRQTEDRQLFAARLAALGIAIAKGDTVTSVPQGLALARRIGYPVMVRAGFALGGAGSGIARNQASLEKIIRNALALSSKVQIEESLWGWKEVEYEIIRDKADNCITVCNMENVDPVGVHTGESIVVAPSQTLTNDEYYSLRQTSIDIIRSLGIIGECNIQFAIHPLKKDIRVIEVNARLSRSSALASKATGYPLAYVAAKLALGKTLPDMRNSVTSITSAFFEPSLDYIVVKIPRWDLDKFPGVTTEIGSEMKSVGEVMSIGRTFPEAIQKAARMLNDGYCGVIDPRYGREGKKQLRKKLRSVDTMRLFTICSAIRAGISVDEICKITSIDRWYIAQLEDIVTIYKKLKKTRTLNATVLRLAKQYGFSDQQIALLRKTNEDNIRTIRIKAHITPWVKRIDTMAGEFPAKTNYLYFTYLGSSHDHVPPPSRKRIAILGAGPYAIGTSVEFDWCAVNTLISLRKHKYETIMVNCNPETVSTDYDYSDVLYFEELTLERVIDIYDIENAPFVCSMGGQIPNNLSSGLFARRIPVLGTQSQHIARAEDRQTFSTLLDRMHIAQPRWKNVTSTALALKEAHRIGYPVMIRSSFVLSGKAMKVVGTDEELCRYLVYHASVSRTHSMVMTQYLAGSRECDVDGVANRGRVVATAVSEHVEPAGIHSGDSTLQLPTVTLDGEIKSCIERITKKIVKSLHIHGPFNIQYLIHNDAVFVIECNLRASRSMPFVCKTRGVNFIELATNIMLNIPIQAAKGSEQSYIGVKVPQFSFQKLRGADPALEVEMSSTGEVASFGMDPYEAYFKAILATGISYPVKKAVLVSLGGSRNKLNFLYGCQKMFDSGFDIYATEGTALFLNENRITCSRIGKVSDHTPNVIDLIKGKMIDFAVVVPREGRPWSVNGNRVQREGYRMRRAAADVGVPIFTNTQTAIYFVLACCRYNLASVPIEPLDWYQSRT